MGNIHSELSERLGKVGEFLPAALEIIEVQHKVSKGGVSMQVYMQVDGAQDAALGECTGQVDQQEVEGITGITSRFMFEPCNHFQRMCSF